MNQIDAINDLKLLEWQIEMGAGEAIGENPVDWFAHNLEAAKSKKLTTNSDQTGQLASQTNLTAPMPDVLTNRLNRETSTALPVASSQDTVGDARKLAAKCSSIDDIIAALENFDACPLSRTASNLCFIDGNRNAKILLIGDVPERDEDLQGKPFVGRSGQLLDKILGHIGLSRDHTDVENSVLISNTVFWRPPGNRKPTESEILMCLPFLNKLIELTSPQLIICLGATPAQRLTGETKGITRLRGRWFNYVNNQHQIPVLATLHPSYLLRQPMQKKLAWRDFLAFQAKFNKL